MVSNSWETSIKHREIFKRNAFHLKFKRSFFVYVYVSFSLVTTFYSFKFLNYKLIETKKLHVKTKTITYVRVSVIVYVKCVFFIHLMSKFNSNGIQ